MIIFNVFFIFRSMIFFITLLNFNDYVKNIFKYFYKKIMFFKNFIENYKTKLHH